MATVATIALWLFALLIVLVLAVVLTPVRLTVLMRSTPQLDWQVAARVFGGISPEVQIHDSSRRRAKRQDKAEAHEPSRAQQRVRGMRLRFITAAPELLVGLLRQISISRLKIDADVGLGDPAETGQLFGLLAPIIYARPTTSAISVDLRPDFVSPRISGKINVELGFVPAAFILPGARFAWRVYGSRQ